MKSFLIGCLCLMLATMAHADDRASSPLLSEILQTLPEELWATVQRPEHELQILYVQVQETSNGPRFHEHSWGLAPERYFYPASTVKFPVALMALEKLATLKKHGVERGTTMLTDTAEDWQTKRHDDPSALSGKPSIEHDVRMIFLVSDNDAYNRLFEFVGVEAIHKRLRELGASQTHIVHRLAVKRAPHHGRFSNPIRFLNDAGDILYRQEAMVASQNYHHGETILKGKGYISQGELIPEPMDFSDNNVFPLPDQHRLLRTLLFPDSVPEGQRWRLSEQDRAFVLTAMSQVPRECTETADAALRAKPDTYVKRFLGWHETPIRDSLRYYNKSGEAYGYLIDNTYINDREHGITFFLAMALHVNANEIFNDDTYEYETIGDPFMQALGKVIYSYEQERVSR